MKGMRSQCIRFLNSEYCHCFTMTKPSRNPRCRLSILRVEHCLSSKFCSLIDLNKQSSSQSWRWKFKVLVLINNIRRIRQVQVVSKVVKWARDTSTSPTDLQHECQSAGTWTVDRERLHRLRFSCEEEKGTIQRDSGREEDSMLIAWR